LDSQLTKDISLQMNEFSNDFMDIEITPSAKSTLYTRDSAKSQLEKKTSSPYETPVSTMKQLLQSDWSVQSFQDPLTMNSTSGIAFHSFPKTQKFMSSQSNAVNGMPLPHLRNSGNSSRPSALSESENASLSFTDETIRYGRRSLAMVIDEVGDDKEMYYNVNNRDSSSDTLVNHSRRSSANSADIEIIPYAPATVPLSMNFNFVGVSVKRQVRISDVQIFATFQRGQYQLKCIKLNKYQPVEFFDLLDANTGLRANRSYSGKRKDDTRNVDLNAEVGVIYTISPTNFHPVFINGWGHWTHLHLTLNLTSILGVRIRTTCQN
jgi:hypothetical protein